MHVIASIVSFLGFTAKIWNRNHNQLLYSAIIGLSRRKKLVNFNSFSLIYLIFMQIAPHTQNVTIIYILRIQHRTQLKNECLQSQQMAKEIPGKSVFYWHILKHCSMHNFDWCFEKCSLLSCVLILCIIRLLSDEKTFFSKWDDGFRLQSKASISPPKYFACVSDIIEMSPAHFLCVVSFFHKTASPCISRGRKKKNHTVPKHYKVYSQLIRHSKGTVQHYTFELFRPVC